MRLFTCDPGGSSGICYAEDGEVVGRAQLSGQHHSQLRDVLDNWQPDRVISEMFTFRKNKKKVQYDSVEYIGVMKLWCQDNGMPYIEQTVGQGKATSENTFWNVEKLKAVGLYLTGQPHANDATAHMLYYITFTLKQHHYLDLLKKLGDFS